MMDVVFVYTVAGAALTGAVAGFVAAGVVRSGGDADAAAEVDHLREQRRRADGAARLERTAKELKQAECDELDRQLRAAELRAEAAQQSAQEARAEAKRASLAIHAATDAAYAARKEAEAAQRRAKMLEKQLEAERRRHKHTKKTMRRKRKVRDVIARGAKRLNRRPFPDRGNGSKRSKFQREAFTMGEHRPVVDHSRSTHTDG